jgi:DNA-binding response OmpR family regulator
MHVLFVHPNPSVYREMQPVLADLGATGAYQPTLDGIEYQVQAHFPDLIVLHPCCLDKGGAHLAQAISGGQRLPVVFLTEAFDGRGHLSDERARLTGMFAFLREQLDRRRPTQVVQVGRLRIHAGRMRVALEDRWIKLPPIQFRILQVLAANADELVTHRELMTSVWGYEASDEEARDLLKVHITQLRRKLGPEFKDYIQAIRGQGYVLVDPDAED